ncbi:MAG TPA: DUF2254 domain-containing protein [Longimicrobiales bacterium]|nr:DUF2254 domain-containing protein [Longimicrobiales bacterium]
MHLDKLTAIWERVRDSLWFLPGVFTLVAAGLAIVTVQLDMNGILAIPAPEDPANGAPRAVRIVFSGTADGARGVLSAIAAGLITVTGVVFSVTIVAIQLASTQFTPRILRNFTADRGNQLVLGVFIGTFTYALLIQRVVRGSNEEVPAFVPNLSVTVALALALVSIGFLIFFIDHAARSVQAAVIIDRVARDALRTNQRTLPDSVGGAMDDDPASVLPDGPGKSVTSRTSGYVQGIEVKTLMRLLRQEGRTIRLEPHLGDFIMTGAPLATLWPADSDPDDSVAATVREAFILGYERTPRLDPELGVVELVDIAVKALSPGINDPTTAAICLDRLSEIVVDFGRRDPPRRVHRYPRTGSVLILPRPEFEHLVETALDQIRHFAAGNPHFVGTILRRLAEIGRLLPAHRHPPLLAQAEAALREALAQEPDLTDARRLQQAAREALDALGGEDAGRSDGS